MKTVIYLFLVGVALTVPGLLFGQFQIEGTLYISDEASIHVWDNIVVSTEDGQLINDGEIVVQGNWTKDDSARFISSTNDTGTQKVLFKNNNFNSEENQRISGQMTGINAFKNLEIQNVGEEGIVDMDHDIEISGNLNFIMGKLRTDTISYGNDGANYAHEVILSNSEETAISGFSMEGEASKYIEGKLNRAVMGMSTYDFPVGGAQQVEFFNISFMAPAPMSSVSGYFQSGATSVINTAQLCDVGTGGANPDPYLPDGNIDELIIDCVIGQWIVEASSDIEYQYDVLLRPSENLQQACDQALYYYVGQDGLLEDCPDITIDDGIYRSGLVDFSSFDVATASEASTTLVSVEIILENDGRIKLFPNPVDEEIINLSIDKDLFTLGQIKASIFDLYGRKIHESELPGGSGFYSISLDSWTAGLYKLVLQDQEKIAIRSFVILED